MGAGDQYGGGTKHIALKIERLDRGAPGQVRLEPQEGAGVKYGEVVWRIVLVNNFGIRQL